MHARREPLDITCDAPSYLVVQVTRQLGLKTPEDVRWLEADKVLAVRGLPVAGVVFHLWNQRLLWPAQVETCSCGGSLPFLNGYLFTLGNGQEVLYAFGQCGRCKTIYWTKG
jgi:hypothetical protein